MFGSLSHTIAGRHAIMGSSTCCGCGKMVAEASHGSYPLRNLLPTTPAMQLACTTWKTQCCCCWTGCSVLTKRRLVPQPFTYRSTLTTCHAPARTPPPATPVPSAAAVTQDLCSSGLPSVCGPCPAQRLHKTTRYVAADLHLYIKRLASRVCLVSRPEQIRCAGRQKPLSCSSRPHQSAWYLQ